MSSPISLAKERRIKRLLSTAKRSFRDIAREVGCSPGTVSRIFCGKTVDRRPPNPLMFRRSAPYICPDCSARAGWQVKVAYRPCVACAAHKAHLAEVVGVQHAAHRSAKVV